MADNQFEQAAPAPEAQIPAAQGPGLYAINYLDNWNGEGDTYYLVAERTKDGRWLNNESGRELLEYQGDAVLEVWPLTSGTTSDKYRAELYDEVWEKARAMGYGNVTEALAALERRQAAQVAVPDGFLLVTQEQLERHATTAWECPPQSRVVLVSSIKRLHDKNAAAPAAPAPAAQELCSVWRAMDTAPKNGTMLRLLVQFTDHATEDGDGPFVTIGANCGDHSGEDVWQFAGWDWCHDRFTQGEGIPVGWRPMIGAEQPDTVKVPRGLLELVDRHYQDGLSINPELEELRALLGKDGEA